MAQLICERLTGTVAESFSSTAMEHGTATEPLARAAYEAIKDVLVDEVAFVEHPTIPMTGASPDGQVGLDGLIEIKCRNTANHLDTLLTGDVPSKYITQMMWQMASTGRQWCDYVSFDNRLPEDLQIFIKRIPRDDAVIAELEKEVVKFLTELDDKIEKLKNLKVNHG